MSDMASNVQPMPDPYKAARAVAETNRQVALFKAIPEEFWEVSGWAAHGNFHSVVIDKADRERIFHEVYNLAMTPPRCEMMTYHGFSVDQVVEFACGQQSVAFVDGHWVCREHRGIKGMTS